LHIRFIFAYSIRVFNLPVSRFCDFTIRCKGCSEKILAPVDTIPDTWIIAQCSLCGERWRYLPSNIFRGHLSPKLAAKPEASRVRRWAK
jgi:hypothetical protein